MATLIFSGTSVAAVSSSNPDGTGGVDLLLDQSKNLDGNGNPYYAPTDTITITIADADIGPDGEMQAAGADGVVTVTSIKVNGVEILTAPDKIKFSGGTSNFEGDAFFFVEGVKLFFLTPQYTNDFSDSTLSGGKLELNVTPRIMDLDIDADGGIDAGTAEEGNGVFNIYSSAGVVLHDLSDGSDDGIITGSQFADEIYGGASDFVADGGLVASDTIDAGGGNDRVFAGDGNDSVLGGDGADSIVGGSGADTLDGGQGADTVLGGLGNDVIVDSASGGTVGYDQVVSGLDAIHYWEFEETSGTVAADSLGGQNATYLPNTNPNQAGVHGGSSAVDLSGNNGSNGNGYVEVQHTASMALAQGTFQVWINPDTVSGTDYIFDKYDGNGAQEGLRVYVVNGVLYASITDNYTTQTINTGVSVVTAGSWQHVAVSFGDGNLTLYHNGTEVAQVASSLNLTGNTEELWIGARQDGSYNENHFDGKIDEFAIHDRALTSTEIADLYGVGPAGGVAGAADPDTYDGGDGVDEVDYSGSAEAVTVNLATGTGTGGAAQGDSYTGIENVTGSAFNDSITGDAGNNVLIGGAGADTISGGDGDDYIEGGDGDDLLTTGLGQDTLIGGAGNDTLMNAAGDDSLVGGDGDDSIVATDGNDTLEGGAGNDTLLGGADNDSLLGGGGNDSLSGEAGNDTLDGGGGADLLDGGAGDDLIIDTGTGGGNTDTVYGGDGNDTIDAGDRSDTVFGGAGNDLITDSGGSLSDDTIYGEAGNDTISGGTREDLLDGGDDADTFLIEDGFGNDTIVGGEGGTDSDTIDLSALTGAVTVSYNGDEAGTITDGTDTINFSQIERLILTDQADVVDARLDNVGVDIVAGAGEDTIIGGAGGDTIDAGAGNDSLTGGGGDDVFSVSVGNDTITDFNFGNTGALGDGDTANNDFIDLSAFYDSLDELRADQADDGILNQSNAFDDEGKAVDYSDNTQFGIGSLTMQGATAESYSYDNTGIVCFAKGTHILTPRGEVPVETLKPGQLVTTLDHGPQPLLWIGTSHVDEKALHENEKLRPILIKKGVLGNQRDLLVSRQHGMMFGPDHLVRAIHLARETRGVRVAHGKREVTYVHLLFERHQIVFAEGIPSEIFYPGPNALKAMATAARADLMRHIPALDVPGAFERREFTRAIYGPTARPFAEAHKVSALQPTHKFNPQTYWRQKLSSQGCFESRLSGAHLQRSAPRVPVRAESGHCAPSDERQLCPQSKSSKTL